MRKARKGRDYTALRDLGVRAVDEVFKMAAPPLREATDLRENMQVRKSEYLACKSNNIDYSLYLLQDSANTANAPTG